MVELIATMVIMGILAATVIPRLGNTQIFSERAFHDQLRAGIDYARKSAVAARRYTCVVITQGVSGGGKAETFIDGSLVPEATGSVNCSSTALTLPGTSCAAGALCPPKDVDIAVSGSSPLTIVFSPNGQPETVSRIPLSSAQNIAIGALSLVVEPVGGLVH